MEKVKAFLVQFGLLLKAFGEVASAHPKPMLAGFGVISGVSFLAGLIL